MLELESFGTLRWENSKNQRYYKVYLGNDLFELCLIEIWGRIGTRLGQFKAIACDNLAHCHQLIRKIEKERNVRGYARVF